MITGPWLVLGLTVIVAVVVGLLVLYVPSLRTLGAAPPVHPSGDPRPRIGARCSKASATSSDRAARSAAPTA